MMILNNFLFSLGSLVWSISVLCFCLQRKHLLNCLLFLEMAMLSVFLMMSSLVTSWMMEGLLSFLLLSFAACEAALGLSLLVILIRSHGNDYVFSLSTHKC